MAEQQEDPSQRLVGMVINLNAEPLTVAVMIHSPQHRNGLMVGMATELRSGATIRLGSGGHRMQGGQVMVLQLD